MSSQPPLLSGLYLGDLETLRSATRDSPTLPTGPTYAHHGLEAGVNKVVPPLLFAGDFCLILPRIEGLQQRMDTLQAFCNDRRLTVNLTKTTRVVFEHKYNPV